VAGRTPFFLTGGNARILLNNRTVAYATNVSYRVSVKNASPRVLGRFEVEVIQPLSYEVTGSMSIFRYGRGLQSYFGEHAPDNVDNKGNGIGSYGLSSFGGAIGAALGLPTSDGQFDGAPNDDFNPSRMFQSKMFNIEIRQKIPTSDFVPGGNEEAPTVLLRDCRFEDMSFELNKKGVATLNLTFRARYADDDTFVARKSGVGQELS
jgi:hypothetical protein